MNINNLSSGAVDQSYPRSESRPAEFISTKARQPIESEKVKPATQNEYEFQVTGSKKEHSEELMKKGLEQANKSLETSNRYIERQVHEKTHAVMYKLKDSITGEVIAEFPPKKIQDMVAKMWEFAGLFVDEKA